MTTALNFGPPFEIVPTIYKKNLLYHVVSGWTYTTMLSLMLRTKRVWIGPATVAAAAISYTLYIEDLNKIDPDLPLVFRPESVGMFAITTTVGILCIDA